jgi:hypothetical protein
MVYTSNPWTTTYTGTYDTLYSIFQGVMYIKRCPIRGSETLVSQYNAKRPIVTAHNYVM